MITARCHGVRIGYASLLLLASAVAGIPSAIFAADKEAEQRRQAQVVEGVGVLVAVSDSGKTAYGFSDETGEWASISVENGTTNLRLITVGYDVATFIAGGKAYAFSSKTGTWDAIEIDETDRAKLKQAVPTVGNGMVGFVAGSKAYAFGAASGMWGKIDLGVEGALASVGTRVQVVSGSKIYMFSAKSKEWSVVDLAKD